MMEGVKPPKPERMKPLFKKDRPWSTRLLTVFTWTALLAVLVLAAVAASLVITG